MLSELEKGKWAGSSTEFCMQLGEETSLTRGRPSVSEQVGLGFGPVSENKVQRGKSEIHAVLEGSSPVRLSREESRNSTERGRGSQAPQLTRETGKDTASHPGD